MPDVQFQITVKLENADSCLGCQALLYQWGFWCNDGHDKGSSNLSRPDSCKADDIRNVVSQDLPVTVDAKPCGPEPEPGWLRQWLNKWHSHSMYDH